MPTSTEHLPLSSNRQICSEDNKLVYLKDTSYSCLRHTPTNKEQCEDFLQHFDMNFYYKKDLKVLAAPRLLFNSSSLSEVSNFILFYEEITAGILILWSSIIESVVMTNVC